MENYCKLWKTVIEWEVLEDLLEIR